MQPVHREYAAEIVEAQTVVSLSILVTHNKLRLALFTKLGQNRYSDSDTSEQQHKADA